MENPFQSIRLKGFHLEFIQINSTLLVIVDCLNLLMLSPEPQEICTVAIMMAWTWGIKKRGFE